MDPAKRPFEFKDDPELLNLTPLETDVQETSVSSDEGKGKVVPDVQITNLSKVSRGKKSRGRSAWKDGSGILGEQPPGRAQAPTVEVHGQRLVSASSAKRERSSAGRSRELRHQSSTDNTRQRPHRSAQGRWQGNGLSSSEDGVESGERRPRVEHRQISLINRTISDDMGSPWVSSHESGDRPRASVRTLYNKPRRIRLSLDD